MFVCSDCTEHEPDIFSGNPVPSFNDLGDASIPTLLGPKGIPQIINSLTSSSIMSGYDSIYLAAPTGELYEYEGWGNGTNQANDEIKLKGLGPMITSFDFPKTTGEWNDDTGAFLPHYLSYLGSK